jgi:chromosome segregation ATPase
MDVSTIISVVSLLIGSFTTGGWIFERRKFKGLATQEVAKGNQEDLKTASLTDEVYGLMSARVKQELEHIITENNDLRKENYTLKVEKSEIQIVVENLQKDVAKLSGTVAGMQSTLANDTKNYNDLSKKYNSLQKAYDNLKKSYTNLKEQFENYKKLHNGTN